MTTREQAQWVLMVLWAGRGDLEALIVVADVLTFSERHETARAVYDTAAGALDAAGYYRGEGVRQDRANLRRAIRSLDEAPR